MAGFLGAAAGWGMLILVGVLIVVFLRQIGLITRLSARRVFRTAALTLLFACLYIGIGALICRLVRGDLENPADLSAIFAGPFLQQTFAAIEAPALLPYPGRLLLLPPHALGKMLFGQFMLAGEVWSLLLTGAGLHLIALRVRRVLGREWAEDVQALLLCLPGFVFFLLPGWLSEAFFLFSVLFCALGQWMGKKSAGPMNRAGLGAAIAGLTVISCAVLTCMVYGRIG